MSILFDLLPSNTRSPLAYAEIAPSRSANALAIKDLKVLCVGQKRLGSQPNLTPIRVFSSEHAQALFGGGSQLTMMLQAFFANNKATECWAISLADPGGGVNEIRTLTFSGTVTAAGTLALYFSGIRIAVPVAAAEAAATTAANVAAAIQAESKIPWTATASGAVTTVTAKNNGAQFAELDIRHSYGANELIPPGLVMTPAIATAGAGVVSYSTAAFFGLIAQVQFDMIASGANDSTNLGYITTELLDRWGPTRQIEGTVYSGFAGDLSASLVQGALLNSQFSGQMPFNASPSPSWVVGAALMAQVAFEAGQDPARGFHTVPLKGVLAPASAAQFTLAEKEQLLRAGMSTYRVGQDGSVAIHRLISNYQTNSGGVKDPTFLSLNTVLTLAYLRYDWRVTLLTKYPRHKLASDGTNFAQGQPIMTPERGRAEAVAWFQKMESAGLVEGLEQFKRDLVVERNPNDPNRLDFLLPVNLINQLEVIGARIEFTL